MAFTAECKVMQDSTEISKKIKKLRDKGWDYLLNNNNEEAKKMFDKAMKMAVEHNDKSAIARINGNYGQYFMEEEEIDSAKVYLEKSEELAIMINDTIYLDVLPSVMAELLSITELKNQSALDNFLVTIEKLEKTRDKNREDMKATIIAHVNISNCYNNMHEIENALMYLNTADSLNKIHGDESIQGTIDFNRADLYYVKQNYDSANKLFEHAKEYYKRNYDINMDYEFQSKQSILNYRFLYYHIAIIEVDSSITLAKKMGNNEKIARGYENKAIILSSLDEIDSSKVYFKLADSIYSEIDYVKQSLLCKSNLIGLYIENNEFTKARRLIEKIREKIQKIDDKQYVIGFYENEARLLMEENLISEAIGTAKKALRLASETNDFHFISTINYLLADIYYSNDNLKSALFHIDTSFHYYKLAVHKDFGLKLFELSHRILIEFKNYKEASIHMGMYIDLLSQRNREISKIQFWRYELEKDKERSIQEKARTKQLEEQNNKTDFYLSIIASLFLILAVVWFFLYRKTRKAEFRLQRANLQLTQARDYVAKNLQNIRQDLGHAAEYIRTMLPKPHYEDEFMKIDYRFAPSAQVGGDALGYRWLDFDNMAFYILDVSGHGICSGLHSVKILNILNEKESAKVNLMDPSEVTKYLNRNFQMQKNNGMMFTFWYGIYNVKTREIHYAGSGNPPGVIVTKDNESILLKSENLFIGGLQSKKVNTAKIKMEPGSSLYLFTDGAFEIDLGNEKYWELNDFIRVLKGLNNYSDCLKRLYHISLTMNKNRPLADDFTVMRLKTKP